MPSTLVVRRPANAPALSVAKLRKQLSDASRLRCSVDDEKNGARFVLGEDDVTVALQMGRGEKPDRASLEFSLSTEVKNVTAVCKAFRALGWTFHD